MKILALLVPLAALNAIGGDIDTVGGTLLHQVDPTLQGTGIPVAQPEADNGTAGSWEVNPSTTKSKTSRWRGVRSTGSQIIFASLPILLLYAFAVQQAMARPQETFPPRGSSGSPAR